MTNISRHQQSIKRRDDTRIGRQHAGLGQQMKITTHALIATATAAATIGLAATAHADEIYDFLSPSGNIVCFVSTSFDGTNGAECEIRDYTYVAPPKPPGCQLGGWGPLQLEAGQRTCRALPRGHQFRPRAAHSAVRPNALSRTDHLQE
jgi:hypothetical protein